MTKIHTIQAFRYGNKMGSSYIVGAVLNLELALQIAEKEEAFRGGKYICEVREFTDGVLDDGKLVRPLESSKWMKIIAKSE